MNPASRRTLPTMGLAGLAADRAVAARGMDAATSASCSTRPPPAARSRRRRGRAGPGADLRRARPRRRPPGHPAGPLGRRPGRPRRPLPAQGPGGRGRDPRHPPRRARPMCRSIPTAPAGRGAGIFADAASRRWSSPRSWPPALRQAWPGARPPAPADRRRRRGGRPGSLGVDADRRATWDESWPTTPPRRCRRRETPTTWRTSSTRRARPASPRA